MLEKLKKMIKNHYDALVVEVEKELKAKMKKERNREDAKRNCLIEKRAKQTSAGRISFLLWFGWIIATLVFAAAISGVLFFLGLTFKFQAAAFFLIPIIINTIVVSQGWKNVEQNHEWVMLLFGKWFTTWEAGLHIMFPFFMQRKGKPAVEPKMYSITLYMNGEMKDGFQEAEINFKDSTSAVIAQIFFSIYGSHRALMNIDDLFRGIREKIDSGMRAYYGPMALDDAIQKKSDTSIDDIITQKDTDADIFKRWGVEIISIAVTDIALPPAVREQRNLVLAAEKAKEVAEIEIKTAKNKAEAEFEAAKIEVETAKKQAEALRVKQEMEGTAAGQEIKSLMDTAKIGYEPAVAFLLTQQFIKGMGDKAMFFDAQNSVPKLAAEFVAIFQKMMEQQKK